MKLKTKPSTSVYVPNSEFWIIRKNAPNAVFFVSDTKYTGLAGKLVFDMKERAEDENIMNQDYRRTCRLELCMGVGHENTDLLDDAIERVRRGQ